MRTVSSLLTELYCRLMVHSDFKRFLTEAGQKLSIDAVYIFTEEGGEVESTEEILHDDVLWVSSGKQLVVSFNLLV